MTDFRERECLPQKWRRLPEGPKLGVPLVGSAHPARGLRDDLCVVLGGTRMTHHHEQWSSVTAPGVSCFLPASVKQQEASSEGSPPPCAVSGTQVAERKAWAPPQSGGALVLGSRYRGSAESTASPREGRRVPLSDGALLFVNRTMRRTQGVCLLLQLLAEVSLILTLLLGFFFPPFFSLPP